VRVIPLKAARGSSITSLCAWPRTRRNTLHIGRSQAMDCQRSSGQLRSRAAGRASMEPSPFQQPVPHDQPVRATDAQFRGAFPHRQARPAGKESLLGLELGLMGMGLLQPANTTPYPATLGAVGGSAFAYHSAAATPQSPSTCGACTSFVAATPRTQLAQCRCLALGYHFWSQRLHRKCGREPLTVLFMTDDANQFNSTWT